MSLSLTQLWLIYEKGVESGDLPTIGSLGLPGLGRRTRMGLSSMDNEDDPAAIETVKRLIARWTAAQTVLHKDVGKGMSDEKKIFELGMEFLKAAKTGKADKVKAMIDDGFPVNFQHPRYKDTALHYAAGCRARKVFNVLVESGQCDYLIRDARGKLAWNNSDLIGRNDEITAILLKETKAQALREGVDLRKDHAEQLRKWFSEPWFNALSRDDDYTP